MKKKILNKKKWLGEKIRRRRLQLDISQKKLAKLLKINPPSICAWEKGISFPSLDKLFLLAKVLEIVISIDNTDITQIDKEPNDVASKI